jgi:hypothetical protein
MWSAAEDGVARGYVMLTSALSRWEVYAVIVPTSEDRSETDCLVVGTRPGGTPELLTNEGGSSLTATQYRCKEVCLDVLAFACPGKKR